MGFLHTNKITHIGKLHTKMGKTNTLKEGRKIRINELKDLIITANQKGKCVSYKKIVAHYCLETGISKRTVVEYLGLLIDSGAVIKKGDDLEYIEE